MQRVTSVFNVFNRLLWDALNLILIMRKSFCLLGVVYPWNVNVSSFNRLCLVPKRCLACSLTAADLFAAKSRSASFGKYDNWYLFIVLKYGVQQNEPLLLTSLRLSAPGSKSSIIMKMGRVGLQANRCLMSHRRMSACFWGIHFFQSRFMFERPKRRSAIPSCMQKVNLKVLHCSTGMVWQ